MAKQLQEYAKKNDLKIIGAGDYKTFYDEGFIDLTPYEWVDLFRNLQHHRQPLPQQETADRHHEPDPDGVEEPAEYRTRPYL